jgi:phosphoribosylaminoimidazole-succinocarboxamide synthase
MIERVGKKRAEKMRDISMAIYLRAREMAEARGIIIADTKIEFGLIKGEVILIDELFTPDSSRFWPMEDYQAGMVAEGFDKQYVRDYLLSLNWDTRPPAPILPPEIVQKTQEKYTEALRRLTTSPGRCFGR